MKRRSFALGTSAIATGLAIDAAIPGRWMRALASELMHGDESLSNERILVVIQWSGGNDGLNTVVPYRNEIYAQARPKLRIDAAKVLKLDDELGLHPSLQAITSLLEAGRLAIVQGVGYPSPNRSHFESMDIWHSCTSKRDRTGSGWLGRYLDGVDRGATADAMGLHIGGEPLPLALVERNVQVPSIASLEQMRLKGEKPDRRQQPAADAVADPGLLGFVATSAAAAMAASQRLETALASPDSSGDYPETALGEKLKIISRLIHAGLGTRIYYVTLDGFDTHANQLDVHARLLSQWADAVSAFCRAMERGGYRDRVLVMTFSEFGRRVAENASLGTDHGAAAPMIFAGPQFASQMIGNLPSLSDLDDGDLKFHTDFRDVYSVVIDQWLNGSAAKILGPAFQPSSKPIPLFRV